VVSLSLRFLVYRRSHGKVFFHRNEIFSSSFSSQEEIPSGFVLLSEENVISICSSWGLLSTV
jgi:hypothetical protein